MHRHSLRVGALGCALVLASLVGGCQGRPSKVEGTVTLDGTPVEGATVTFVPQEGKGHPAIGLTGSDGAFRLTTYNTGDGALPGAYKVTVAVNESGTSTGPPGTADSEVVKKMMMEAFKKADTEARSKSKGKVKSKASIPAVYTEVRTTPLQYTVPVSGKLAIELKSTGGS